MTSVDAWLSRIRSRIGSTLWPPNCVLCGGAGQPPQSDICNGCAADLPTNAIHCAICAQPLPMQGEIQWLCGACLKRRPRFDVCSAPYRYAYPLDHMIRRLKYGGAIANGRVLGDLLSASLAAHRQGGWPELVLPVPLAHGRFRERGYNQAIVLAERVCAQLSIPLRADLLVRVRETQVQAGLDQKARRKNIRGAFALAGSLRARHIAVLDDVVTTGSTVNEVAKVLKRAGARRVEVWAVARAGR